MGIGSWTHKEYWEWIVFRVEGISETASNPEARRKECVMKKADGCLMSLWTHSDSSARSVQPLLPSSRFLPGALVLPRLHPSGARKRETQILLHPASLHSRWGEGDGRQGKGIINPKGLSMATTQNWSDPSVLLMFSRANQRLEMDLKAMSIISTHVHPGMEPSPLASRSAIQPSLLYFFSPALFILIALFFKSFLPASREFKMWVGQKYAFWIPLSI